MTSIPLLVEVDWDAAGSFVGTGKDVSDRVRQAEGVTAARGRDQLRVLAPPMAGSLDVTLDNQSKDYSIEFASSPLYGNLLPGRLVRASAKSLSDTFTRADSASSLGNSELAGTWTVSGTWGISSNQAYSVSDAANDLARLDALHPDQIVKCTVSGDLFSPSYRLANVMFRHADTSNYLYVDFFAGNLRLVKVDGGVGSELDLYSGGYHSATQYAVRIEAVGNLIRVWVDGTLRIIYTLTGGDTKYAGATYRYAGLMLNISGAPAEAARWDDFAVYIPLATGRIDDILQHPEIGVRTVDVPCLGQLARLRGQKISTALYESITTDVALGYLLDALGWTDTLDRVFDTGKTTLSYWWLDNEDAFDAAVSLLASEGPGASLYEDRHGRIVFENRHYRLLTTRSTTSQATIRDTGAEPKHSPPFGYDAGMKSVVNIATLDVKRRSAKTLAAVWSLGATLTLAAGEVWTTQIKATAGDPFTAAVSPLLAATDYTVTAGSVSSAVLDRTSGASATLTITAGASGATLTGLQVRAQLVSVDGVTRVANTIDTSTSQTKYGIRPYPLATRAEIAISAALDFCNAVVSWYQSPRSTASVIVNNGAYARRNQILFREISDRITVVEAQTGLSAAMFIERIEQSVLAGGAYAAVVLGCEKAAAVKYFVLETSAIDGPDVIGY